MTDIDHLALMLLVVLVLVMIATLAACAPEPQPIRIDSCPENVARLQCERVAFDPRTGELIVVEER